MHSICIDINKPTPFQLFIVIKVRTYIPQARMSKASHIAFFAFPFGSHALSLLNIVRRLAASAPPGAIFSFFSTATSNSKIFSAGSPKLVHNLKAYNVWDGVEVGLDSPKSPIEAIGLFLKAAPHNFKKAVQEAEAETGVKVSCLLTDAFLWFSGEIAEEMGVPWVAYRTGGACSLSAHVHTDLIRSTTRIGTTGTIIKDSEANLEFLPGLSAIRIGDLPEEVISGDIESPFAKMLHSMGLKLVGATAVVLNSFEELEPMVTNDLKSNLKNVLNVGPSAITVPQLDQEDESGSLVWLDKHKASSVAYISFGTVLVPPPNEVAALAEALEASKIPFLWSLRDDAKKLLPKGFSERTSGLGKLVSWAPQLQVLAHRSIGVFVTHSGWNSIVETIFSEVPMICRPFFGDQMLNCRMTEAVWKIGVKVEGGIFTKSGTMNALDIIMCSEKGKEMKNNAGILRGRLLESVGPNGSSTKNFEALTDLLFNA